MTLNECTTDERAITAAQVQGLHAFMASEALLNASDTQIERAARTACAPAPTLGPPRGPFPCQYPGIN